MESYIYIIAGFIVSVVASLLDPVRWIVCALAGWLVPNFLLAQLVGIFTITVLTVRMSHSLQDNIPPDILLAQAAASGLVVGLFYFLRIKQKNKQKLL